MAISGRGASPFKSVWLDSSPRLGTGLVGLVNHRPTMYKGTSPGANDAQRLSFADWFFAAVIPPAAEDPFPILNGGFSPA